MTTTPSIKLLLVDDEPRNLDALEVILADQGYDLLRATDSDTALKMLLQHDVAAIVLDIQMPDVSGFELARLIKGTKKFREIPILFLTAHLVDDSDVISGYGAGAVDYLTKPLNPQILKLKLGVFAELFRKTRALAELNETLEKRVQERTAELERSEAQLRQEGRKKDEFLSTLAHELRNPLAPLRTGVDILLKTQTSPTPVVARTLAAMDRQVGHLVRLIDDLLDVSRINRGIIELRRERTDLARLVHSTVETFRSLLDTRSISLVVSTRPRLFADVDPVRIAQLLGNILHNASKFTPEGGTVRVELDGKPGRATLRVSDTGIGIPVSQVGRVFDLFSDIERGPGAPQRGAGIGLALARKLAQLHDGDLSVFSAGENRGTTLTLELPTVPEEVPAVPANTTPVATAAPTAIDVLVIEDNDDVADTLASLLEDLGHRASIARKGVDGVRMVSTGRPHLVLCDLGLPDIDGTEVCRRIRALGPDVSPTMVALTGWGQEEARKRTQAAGFDKHLVKPISVEALEELLAHVSAQLAAATRATA